MNLIERFLRHPVLFGILAIAALFLVTNTVRVVPETQQGVVLRFGEPVALVMQRLQAADVRRAKEDLQTLIGFAKHEKWPKQQIRFLQDFLADNGVE